MINTVDETRERLALETAFKVLLIDAICGVGFPNILLGGECEKVGLAAFDNGHYTWKRSALAGNATERLQELYQALCEAREEEVLAWPE